MNKEDFENKIGYTIKKDNNGIFYLIKKRKMLKFFKIEETDGFINGVIINDLLKIVEIIIVNDEKESKLLTEKYREETVYVSNELKRC